MTVSMKSLLATLLVLGGIAHAQPNPVVAGSDETAPAAPSAPTEPAPATAPVPEPVPAPTVTPTPASPGLTRADIDAIVDERLSARKDNAGWKDSFFVQTQDAKTRLKIGAFTQFDGRF